MPLLLKKSHLGTALMIISPVVALGFGSEVFFPVAVTSFIGCVICLICKSLTTRNVVGQITAELLNDLVSADTDRRELVLSELDQIKRKWFVLEIARIEAEPILDWGVSRSERIKAVMGAEPEMRCGCQSNEFRAWCGPEPSRGLKPVS